MGISGSRWTRCTGSCRLGHGQKSDWCRRMGTSVWCRTRCRHTELGGLGRKCSGRPLVVRLFSNPHYTFFVTDHTHTRCALCGSDKTAVRTDAHHEGYPRWRRHPETGEYICDTCARKLRARREYQYKDRRVTTKQVQRTGYCSLCPRNTHDGSASMTARHHLAYNDKNPAQYTIEICNVCHAEIHGKLRGESFEPLCYGCEGNESKGSWYYNYGTRLKLCKYCYVSIFLMLQNRLKSMRHYYRHRAVGVRS